MFIYINIFKCICGMRGRVLSVPGNANLGPHFDVKAPDARVEVRPQEEIVQLLSQVEFKVRGVGRTVQGRGCRV